MKGCSHLFETKPDRGRLSVSCVICYRCLGTDELLRGYLEAEQLRASVAELEQVKTDRDDADKVRLAEQVRVMSLRALVGELVEWVVEYGTYHTVNGATAADDLIARARAALGVT